MATAAKKPATEEQVNNEEEYDPWKDMVEVFMPRQQAGDEPTMFVGVNGHFFLLPMGKRSVVPMPIYKEIEAHFAALGYLADVEASIPNN